MKTIGDLMGDRYGPQTAAVYDETIRQYCWGYELMLEAIALEAFFGRYPALDSPFRILDLGMGTGNLSQTLLKGLQQRRAFRREPRLAQIEIVGVDQSMEMLKAAKLKLTQSPKVAVSFHLAPFEELQDPEVKKGFDLVVSSYALHHLNGEQLLLLYGKILAWLKPGGNFVFGDKVTETDSLMTDYHRVLTARLHPLFDAGPPTLEEAGAALQKSFDDDGDQPSPLESHLEWLETAGFHRLRIPHQTFGTAVISTVKPR